MKRDKIQNKIVSLTQYREKLENVTFVSVQSTIPNAIPRPNERFAVTLQAGRIRYPRGESHRDEKDQKTSVWERIV